jgi:branched-subunit amino acid aminotransferase/4-amino-4-deoxychorismate lyase
MEYCIYNNDLVESSKLTFSYNERSFLYGDGFFETIIVKNNSIQFISLHKNRIEKASKALFLNTNITFLENQILQLCKQNKLETARVKVVFWRKKGGLYTPETSDNEYLIVTEKYFQPSVKTIDVDFASESYKYYSSISGFKTLNSLPYILAGLEAKRRGIEDLILISPDGYVSETISSTLYYIVENQIYTPSLKTGCIAGIIRQKLLNANLVKERDVLKTDFFSANAAFTSNVAGIKLINKVGEKELNSSSVAIKAVLKSLNYL